MSRFAINQIKALLVFFLSVSLLVISSTTNAKPSWKNNDGSNEGPTKGGGKGGKNKTTTSTISIIQYPQSQTITEGDAVSFSVEATSSNGQTLAYQWHFNGSIIEGATNNQLTLNNSQISDSGDYRVRINTSDATARTTASLTVEAAPTIPSGPDIEISLQPSSQEAYIDESLTLNVSATGSGTLYYQWRKDGAVIPNAIHSYLSITNAQETQTGNYDVIITNETGSVTSLQAQITINPLSTISLEWAKPTDREDGTELAQSDITGYNIHLSYENELEEVITVPGDYTSLVLEGMYAGAYEFAIATIDQSGNPGRKSNYETLLVN